MSLCENMLVSTWVVEAETGPLAEEVDPTPWPFSLPRGIGL